MKAEGCIGLQGGLEEPGASRMSWPRLFVGS